MSHISRELRKAFDHVGLDGELTCEGGRASPDGFVLNLFSFEVPEAYVFREPGPDTGWLRVDEVLPGPDEEVLVWPSLSGKVEQVLYGTPEGDRPGGFMTNGTPTRWMSLPDPPSEVAS